ncbi:unnamed protein product [Parajaminaea phylloscopi]
MRFAALALVTAVVASVAVDARLRLGLAWGTDNRWAKTIAKGDISFYHHWQEGAVDQMPKHIEYVPMFWGPKYWGKWEERKQEIKKFKSNRILAFNEPDVKGQSDMTPEYAATLFMKELQPYRKKGIKVSSPQIVWDVNWMDSFLKHLRAKGGDVDFMAIHWYGSYTELSKFKKWVSKIHKRYNKAVWVTEYGVTASSHPSQGQIKNFHVQATNWMRKVGYVKRAAWLGCFAVSNPPDSYAAARNAFFANGGSLRTWAKWYVYSGASSKRSVEASAVERSPSTPGALRHRNARAHRAIMEQQAELAEREDADAASQAEEAEEDEDDGITYQGEAVHCDEYCQMRAKALEAAADVDDDLKSDDDEGDKDNWVD